MKPWKPCEHCYLKDKYCENAERELPCVPVQEYLKSGYEIKRLQNLLEMSEKEQHKTLQQLAIASKALNLYADKGNWCDCLSWNGFMEDNEVVYDGQFGEKGFEPAQKALKEIDLVGTPVKGKQ